MNAAVDKLLDALSDLVDIRDGLTIALGANMNDSDLDEDIGSIKEAVVMLLGIPDLPEFDFLFDDVWSELDKFLESNIEKKEFLDSVEELKEGYGVSGS